MADDISQHDAKRRRCGMLGHEVPFTYCREPGGPVPCRRIFDCWRDAFDVETFMRQHYAQETIERMCAPPTDKACTLVDLIRRAREATASDDD